MTCGGGYQIGTRQCIDSLTQQAVSSWNCVQATSASISNTEQVLQVCNSQACPVWSNWSDWSTSTTSNTCGMGVSTRTRDCLYGGTPNVDAGCAGATWEQQYKHAIACSLSEAPVQLQSDPAQPYSDGLVRLYDDVQALWGTVCTDGFDLHAARVVCRSLGMQDANGTYELPVQQPVLFALVRCAGTEQSLQACVHQVAANCSGSVGVRCVSSGFWLPWSSWSPCSVTCGTGLSTRQRVCSGPFNGGLPCDGNASESVTCDMQACPRKYSASIIFVSCYFLLQTRIFLIGDIFMVAKNHIIFYIRPTQYSACIVQT